MSEVILAMSSCRTSVTEVYQSGPATLPVPDGWGCEILTASQQTKYVNAVHTNANGGGVVTQKGPSIVAETTGGWRFPPTPPSATVAVTPGKQTLFGLRCG